MRADGQRQSGAEREGEAAGEVGEAGGEGVFKGITVFSLEWLAVGTRTEQKRVGLVKIPSQGFRSNVSGSLLIVYHFYCLQKKAL